MGYRSFCHDPEVHGRDFKTKFWWRDRLHEWRWHGGRLFVRKPF